MRYAAAIAVLIAFYACVGFAVYWTGSGWCLWALFAVPICQLKYKDRCADSRQKSWCCDVWRTSHQTRHDTKCPFATGAS